MSSIEALGRGDIGEEHVRIVRQFFDRLPVVVVVVVVDAPTREAAEQQLAVIAAQFRPEQLRTGAARMMALLNPDGEFSDADRARRRGVSIGPRGFDGMSPISGLLDPETRGVFGCGVYQTRSTGHAQPELPNTPRRG